MCIRYGWNGGASDADAINQRTEIKRKRNAIPYLRCRAYFCPEQVEQLKNLLSDCDCARFSDGEWYKFTKKTATKERAILIFCAVSGISAEEITAFGVDYVDIGMLKLCGLGIDVYKRQHRNRAARQSGSPGSGSRNVPDYGVGPDDCGNPGRHRWNRPASLPDSDGEGDKIKRLFWQKGFMRNFFSIILLKSPSFRGKMMHIILN